MRLVERQSEKNAASGEEAVSVPAPRRALSWMRRVWPPVASVAAAAVALLILWHGVIGKNGLLVWQQKRAEDIQLRKQIDELNQENARLRNRIEQLKTNPDAIGVVARDKLHYAKPNEVIVQLPPEQKKPTQPAGTGK